MKVRNGFVSNSSSSSFVVLLPENFLDTVDYEKIRDGDEDFPIDALKQLLENLVKDECLYMNDVYDADAEDYELDEVIDEIMEPYVIAEFDTGPDEGSIVVADREKVKTILA